jgi:hypothetical protein
MLLRQRAIGDRLGIDPDGLESVGLQPGEWLACGRSHAERQRHLVVANRQRVLGHDRHF